MFENAPLDPFIDVLRAECSMVKSPIAWSYLAIDGDGGNGPVDFELIGRYMEELNAWVKMVGGWDDAWKSSELLGFSVSVEEDSDVLGLHLLEELILFLDH